jgi:DNA-directed RNA polymerase subunit RPC12/RpoP
MTYMCQSCGRQSRLPDYCHGQPMSQQVQYTCPKCGRTSNNFGTCCGQQMLQG